MKYSAIVLSGGRSSRFGRNKSLVPILGKPMISYVVDAVSSVVDEVLVVIDSEDNKREFVKILGRSVKVLLDEYHFKSPVVGASTGFGYAKGEFSLLLACDAPLLSTKVLALLLDCLKEHDAVIPRWPNGYIEPLHAVYDSVKAYEASFCALTNKELSMRSIIRRLRNVLYVPTNTLSRVDPMLHTFCNVNTIEDLKQIERILMSA